MRTRLLLILCLTGNVFTQKPPDVRCTVIHMKYVECLWKSPDVNYTFYSRFFHDSFRECNTYITEDSLNVGCKQPEETLKSRRFNSFYTKLEWGKQNRTQTHKLENKVKLNPPTNLTVQFRSDSNLWFEWRQIFKNCVESEVRYRVNDNDWTVSKKPTGVQEYCIHYPSNTSRYELQVRSRVANTCGQSDEWSDWSEPAVWGTHNITDRAPQHDSVNVWSVVVYCVGATTLLLLVVLLLHHDRIRIILIPVVPKPSLVPDDLQEWINSSKGLKEAFKTDYLERTCSVRECSPILPSDSESSDSSIISLSTDQTSNADFVPVEEESMSV